MDLTIWLGPIAGFQFTPQGWPSIPGSSVVNFEVHNAAQASPLVSKWTSQDGRVLPGLLAQIGATDVNRLSVGSFSAGHNIAKALTRHPDDRAMITALMLADSEQSGVGVVPPGYLAYASESALGAPRLFCASASTFSDSAHSYWSSQETMDAMTAQIGPSLGGLTVPALAPPPVSGWNMGNALVLNYEGTLAHEKHATLLAPQLWSGLLVPWLAGGMDLVPPGGTPPATDEGPSGGATGSGWGVVAGLAALVAAGYGAYRFSRHRSS